MPRLAALLIAAAVTASASEAPAAAPGDLAGLTEAERLPRIGADARLVPRLREGLGRAVSFARSRPDLFPAAGAAAVTMPSRTAREEILGTWKAVLDADLALSSIERFHQVFWRLDGTERAGAFAVARAAFLTRYRFALEFLRLAERDGAVSVILNDAVPDLGLPTGSYDRYAFHFLNVAAASRFAALAVLEKALLPAGDPLGLDAVAAQDSRAILGFGAGAGQALTAANALDVVRSAGAAAWFPVQAGVSEWMGDTKVRRLGTSLVSAEQIRDLAPRLRPGDILLERREWYLSNIGLPGFWPHAALYVGTPQERRAFLGTPGTAAWVRAQGGADGDLETLLARRFPEAHRLALAPQEAGHLPRVLEAMSEGVVFTTLEHSAAADSLAVLRPRLEPPEIAAALVRAFGYSGRPYDFEFDFLTDAALVCTELVYKAYEPAPGYRGLRFPLRTVLGRTVTPANELVRQFDADAGTERQQSDLVLFLDGQERLGAAVPAGLEEFRGSWRRPKWHVIAQEARAP